MVIWGIKIDDFVLLLPRDTRILRLIWKFCRFWFRVPNAVKYGSYDIDFYVFVAVHVGWLLSHSSTISNLYFLWRKGSKRSWLENAAGPYSLFCSRSPSIFSSRSCITSGSWSHIDFQRRTVLGVCHTICQGRGRSELATRWSCHGGSTSKCSVPDLVYIVSYLKLRLMENGGFG